MQALNNLGTKSRLIIILLLIGIGATIMIAALSWRTSKEALVEAAMNELQGVRELRAEQVENYFDTLHRTLLTLSEEGTVINAMTDLNREFQMLDREIPEDAWWESIDNFYLDEYFPELAPSIDYEPTIEDFAPYRNATAYLQYHYISQNEETVGEKYLLDDPGDGSEYSRFHAKYHPFFRNLLERTGYQNFYLIDSEKRDIVYSTRKEVDFGTSLMNGPHSYSGLAEIANSVGIFQEGIVTIVDFRPYEPTTAELGAFVLTPIYNGVHHIGILAIQISTEPIDQIMTGNQEWSAYGLGDSGESYVLGIDDFDPSAIFPTLRSNARLWLEQPEEYIATLQGSDMDPRAIEAIEHFQSTIGLLPAEDEWISKALYNGATGIREKQNYLGETVLSAYGPLEVEGLLWAIFAEMKTSEIMQPVYEQQRRFLIAGAVLTALIALSAMMLAYYFTAPLKSLIEQTERINAGDLETTTELKANNEYGRLSRAVNLLVNNMREKDAALTLEQEKNHRLMLNILPEPIAERFSRGETQIVENVEQTSILYAEIIGFAELAEQRDESVSANQLKELFVMLDATADRMGIELRPLVGTHFLATCGLTQTRLDHVNRVVEFALRLQTILQQSNQNYDSHLAIKIGVHTGEVTAGLIGDKRMRYDLWGKSVNTASAIQVAAEPDMILVSQEIKEDVAELYNLQPHSKLQFKDNTEMALWALSSPTMDSAPQINPTNNLVNNGISVQLHEMAQGA